jgi:hypothetical protein
MGIELTPEQIRIKSAQLTRQFLDLTPEGRIAALLILKATLTEIVKIKNTIDFQRVRFDIRLLLG